VPIHLELEDSRGQEREVHLVAEVRSCRAGDDGQLVGTRIVELEPAARVALMEWCYVVCSHAEVRGSRPGTLMALEDARQAPQPAVMLESLPSA
jgi:hypothetical protein